MRNDLHALNGYNLVEDVNAVKQIGTRQVKRSFFERFFSLPWRPWQIAEEVPVFEPSDEFVVTEDSIIGHPQFIRALREHHGIDD